MVNSPLKISIICSVKFQIIILKEYQIDKLNNECIYYIIRL